MSATIYLETQSNDPCYNLAFEEYILQNRTDGSYLILWQNAPSVIIGRNQNTAQEVNAAYLQEHAVPAVRRITGGGAVYHDLGNLNYSFISDAHDIAQRTSERFTGPVVYALRGLGLDACASGRNDILVSGCKVSGTASHIWKGRVLHHGTLLFDSDAEAIANALTPDPIKFTSKSVKSVKSRVGNIRSFLPSEMTLSHFWNYLKTALTDGGMIRGSITEEEHRAIEQLRDTKYRTWEWNYGRSPDFSKSAKKHWSGGILELSFTVERGTIRQFRILGDFMALSACDPLEAALIGCPFREDDMKSVLEGFDLSLCLGTITAEEFLQTAFQN